MSDYFHSVELDERLCKGCTNCIKRCPTDAIRVRKGKARIMNERCIDCGECVRICPYRAKVAHTDSLDILADYQYTVALPAPTLYMQFNQNYTREHIVYALKLLGFDYVYEVARGAEIVTEATDRLMEKPDTELPLISSACPAVVRLIQVRFPSLIPHLVPVKSPMEISAMNARREFCEANHVAPEDVGVFFISPCAAKMTSVRAPIELKRSNVDGVFSIKTIYFKLLKLLSKMKDKEVENFLQAGHKGIRWASTGGEALALKTDKVLSVDGIQNVVHIFDELENDKIEDVDFIEASACTGGCLGGPLTVENLYVAKTRNRRYINMTPRMLYPVSDTELQENAWEVVPPHRDVTTLDSDITEAMKKLRNMNEIYEQLPALDCGACGAPSCRALAEDVVRGYASTTDCIFILREKVRELAQQMIVLEGMMPPVMDREDSNT